MHRGGGRPDQPGAQIALTPERVAPFLTNRMVGDRVDGEVPPGQVLVQTGTVFDHRVPPVGDHVPPEGGDFVQLSPPIELSEVFPTGPLQHQDVGPEIGQEHPAERAWADASEFDDPEPGERSGHAS